VPVALAGSSRLGGASVLLDGRAGE